MTASRCVAEGPSAAAISAYDSYVRAVEARLTQQHGSAGDFLVPGVADLRDRLNRGEFVVEQITPDGGLALPGALLHHWRGTVFVPGATAAGLSQVFKDFGGYAREFSPQVVAANAVRRGANNFEVSMRLRQHDVITVVLDATYEVVFGQLDARHGYSSSRSTRIVEIGSDGKPLSESREHGFLWRQNTYWSYEERDGGLYVQIESISLTRSIPRGLGWAVGPFVASVPRDSLEFTLRAVCNTIHNERGARG